jgi:hypothetical protein
MPDIEEPNGVREDTEDGLCSRDGDVILLPLTICDRSFFTSQTSSMSSEVRDMSNRKVVSRSSSVITRWSMDDGRDIGAALLTLGDSPRVIPRESGCVLELSVLSGSD